MAHALAKRLIASAAIVVPVALAHEQHLPGQASVSSAGAVIRPLADSSLRGLFALRAAALGLEWTVQLTGLMPGFYRLQIHEFGRCDSRDGSTAGAVFDPNGAPQTSPTERAGALGTLYVDYRGVAEVGFRSEALSLGGGTNCVLGRSVLLLDQDGETRIGCGVIEERSGSPPGR